MTLVITLIILAVFTTIAVIGATEEGSTPQERAQMVLVRKNFRVDWLIGVTFALIVMAVTTKAMFGLMFINFGYIAMAFYVGWFIRGAYVFLFNIYRRLTMK